MSIDSFFVFLSVSLTPMTMLVGAGVLILWVPSALKAVKISFKTEADWLMIGVVISFSSIILESFYWGVHLAAEFLSINLWLDMVAHGGFVNTIVGQGAAIAAGLCHIKGGNVARTITRKVVLYGTGLTFITAALLLHFSNNLI